MFPFSTSIYLILKNVHNDQTNLKNIDPKFSLKHEADHYLISKLPDMTWNQLHTMSESLRQSSSYLPVSTRNDRFKDRLAYAKMYSYPGLIDTKQYSSIKMILNSIDNWNFNIFALERFTSGTPLTYLSIHLFEKHNLINHFQLDISKLFQFLVTIERSYHQSNPYHNALHAADVTQAINCIIQDKQIFNQLSMIDIQCSLISTICHDVDHPGLNNMFMINTNHHLSLLYKSKTRIEMVEVYVLMLKLSVLENHHWAFSVSVLRQTNLFVHFSKDLWNQVTNTCGSLIKATDISRQNAYLADFNEILLSKNEATVPQLNDQEKLLVLQMAIKCADICNPCRRWDICNCWAYLVTEEFLQQGDKERMLSLPISPIMDREKSKQAIVQRDFIKYLVLPLFTMWHQFMDSNLTKNILEFIDYNQNMWQHLSDLSTSEFNNIILSSIQSVYDRIQLMHVMDYTKNHQLSHLQKLLTDTKPSVQDESILLNLNKDSINLDENLITENFHLYDVSEITDENQPNHFQQYRRGSLPISLQSYNRESFSSSTRKSLSSNRPKIMIRRTSLQPGEVCTTSFITTSISKVRNSSVQFVTPVMENPIFPTASRRKSAPAIKVNQSSLLESINFGRRGSLSGYICSNKMKSGLCSSQSQLFQPANSLNDIQMIRIG